MDQPTLYCFYDLEVSPPSYDFFTYMQLAELHRKRHNLSSLFFVFVPGPKRGFRDDNLSKTIPQRYAMMHNVVIPSCQLLPSCEGVVWLQQRDKANLFFEKANGHVFPRDYTPQKPNRDYVWAGIVAAYLRNERFTVLREPLEYTEMVDGLFPNDRKKLITVTIREAPYHTARNTNCQAWWSFLKTLDPSKYKIVIIPDTNNLSNNVFEGFEYCWLASIDVLFRTAIYRKAYLNMFQIGGTINAASFSNSPFLATYQFHTGELDPAASERWFRGVGAIDPNEGHQHAMWKKNQYIAWQLDTVDILEETFKKYTDEFPEKSVLPVEEHGFQSTLHKKLACQVAFEYVQEKSIIQVEQEDIDTLKAIVNLMPNFIDPRYMLAMIGGQVGEFNTAIQLFDDCINLLETEFCVCSDSSEIDLYKTFCQSKAETLEKANRVDEALYEYVKINERYPNDNHVLERISSLGQNQSLLEKV